MTIGNQVRRLAQSTPSDADLEQAASELASTSPCLRDQSANYRSQTSTNLVIDPQTSNPRSFTIADTSIRAILVYKDGPGGAVRVTGPGISQNVLNVVTGPDETGLEIVEVIPGQTCMFFGQPTVRYFRHNNAAC